MTAEAMEGHRVVITLTDLAAARQLLNLRLREFVSHVPVGPDVIRSQSDELRLEGVEIRSVPDEVDGFEAQCSGNLDYSLA